MPTVPTPLRVRSYASDRALHAHGDTAPQWTLFVRQQQDANGSDSESETVFVFTVIVPKRHATTCAVYERRLGRDAIHEHIEELGIEVQAPAFTELLLKTLATRKSVNVVMEEEEKEEKGDSAVSVILTYKFSETISRKGQVVLDCVSMDVPLAVATLLHDIHTVQNESVLTEAQKLQKQTSIASATQAKHKASSTTASSLSVSVSLSQESNLSTDGETAVAPTTATTATTATVNPQLLKRRHVPTGTARRKGPRGAKLAKIK